MNVADRISFYLCLIMMLFGLFFIFIGIRYTSGQFPDLTVEQRLVGLSISSVIGIGIIVAGSIPAFRQWKQIQVAKLKQRPSNQYLSQQLQAIRGFTDEELAQNRRGVLTQDQEQKLRTRDKWLHRAIPLFGLSLIIGFSIGFFVLAAKSGMTSANLNEKVVEPMLFPIGICSFLFCVFVYNVRSIRLRYPARAEAFEGDIKLYMAGRGAWLRIAGKTFEISDESIKAFWNGARYRIYTAGGRILSAELAE